MTDTWNCIGAWNDALAATGTGFQLRLHMQSAVHRQHSGGHRTCAAGGGNAAMENDFSVVFFALIMAFDIWIWSPGNVLKLCLLPLPAGQLFHTCTINPFIPQRQMKAQYCNRTTRHTA